MAYFSQDKKKQMQPLIKALLKKYNLKGSLSVKDMSQVILTIKSGSIDFLIKFKESDVEAYERGYESIYLLQANQNFKRIENKKAIDFLQEAKAILMEGNHDNSDSMTDYLDIGWYASINIGKLDKPYILV